jgi:hypothetical protein
MVLITETSFSFETDPGSLDQERYYTIRCNIQERYYTIGCNIMQVNFLGQDDASPRGSRQRFRFEKTTRMRVATLMPGAFLDIQPQWHPDFPAPDSSQKKF